MTLDSRFWQLWAAILATPMLLFALLQAFPSLDRYGGSQDFHFWIVSGTTVAAALTCAAFIARARSLRETRTIFLALAFMAIAAIFAVHGLGTPGHIHQEAHAELGLSSWLSVLAGAFFIALSALTPGEKAEEWVKANGSALFKAVALGLGIYVGLSFVTPDWLAWIPFENRTVQLAVSGASIGMLAFGAWRYLQSFLFARLPSQWAMVAALVLLIEVQVSLTFGRFWSYSWWEYHFLYGAAFLVLFAGWAIEVVRAGSLGVFAEGLSMRDAVAQLNRGQTQPIADLIDALELKDVYTLGHVRRVAVYAFNIGKELKLSPAEQRNLVLAAQMHDVGKIGTPDRILTKPGPLTKEEFDVIKEHVHRGYDIANSVPVLRPVAEAIRGHHEKYDGSGYPMGLTGDSIPLLARIVAVADAYDAMTSGRVYQPAVSADEAMQELRRCSGGHFDPACVHAFMAAMARSGGATPPVSTRPEPVVPVVAA